MYAAAEAANASPLQTFEQGLLGVINAPTDALFGRPLIGNGADGVAGSGQAGGAGGFLIGNGVTAVGCPRWWCWWRWRRCGLIGAGGAGGAGGVGSAGGAGGRGGLFWGVVGPAVPVARRLLRRRREGLGCWR